jgi:ferrous-iron efflux pump FieF
MSLDRHNLNLSAGAASMAVAATLVALKGWAQVQTGSLSIAASMVDSLLDLMIAAANFAAIRYAARPADADHQFGHTAAEDIAALAQAAIVGVSAIAIAAGAAWRLTHPSPLTAEAEGAAVMILSLLLTGALIAWQMRVARLTGSKVVRADMAHYLSDFLPMLGALAALAASRFLDAGWLDPVLALIAAAWILRTGLGIGRSAWDGLMDREAPAETVARIAAIADGCEGLEGWHDLRTRMSGTRLFVQIHAEIDGSLSLRQAHAIGEQLRRDILAISEDVDVIVHHDPVTTERDKA